MINTIFYLFKPIIPRWAQIWLRRLLVYIKKQKNKDIWPINYQAAKTPAGWKGWPDNKIFAFVLTHDVELQTGHDKCVELMGIEQKLGFKSSFNFVPERYSVSTSVRDTLTENGFEVGVHGLNHDGKLFSNERIFKERAQKINYYLKEWQAVGFRAPAMHHNLDWIHQLNIKYDLSTFDTDPFEPQSDGVGTIFPFIVQDKKSGSSYLEMPYTLPQDFTLFALMKEKNIDIWKKKVDWIAENRGMVLVNIHPDYICFENEKKRSDQFPIHYYEELLIYIKTKYEGKYWHTLPKNIAEFCLNTFEKKQEIL